jgi:hypothetical protein
MGRQPKPLGQDTPVTSTVGTTPHVAAFTRGNATRLSMADGQFSILIF